jgi:hypothetical protein
MQPVSGPYAAAASAVDTINGGLHLAYLDSAGVGTSDPLRVSRVRIRLRAPIGSDSVDAVVPLAVAVGFRNLRR